MSKVHIVERMIGPLKPWPPPDDADRDWSDWTGFTTKAYCGRTWPTVESGDNTGEYCKTCERRFHHTFPIV